MADALSGLMGQTLSQAGTFVTSFGPVLYTVGGLVVGMGVLFFARDFFKRG